jgi:hypothetical protein
MMRLALAFCLAIISGIACGQPIDGNSGGNGGAGHPYRQPTEEQQPIRRGAVEGVLERISRAIDTANEQANAPDEQKRAERDLHAQEQMAKWAKYMLYIAGGEIIVTLTGVVLVLFTLIYTRDAARAARDAVDETRRIGEAQTRAYVSIEGSEVSNFGNGVRPSVTTVIKNTGQTPAYDLKVHTMIGIGPLPYPGGALPDMPPPDPLGSTSNLGPGVQRRNTVTKDNPVTDQEFIDICEGREAIFVIGRVEYSDAFGIARFTNFFFLYSQRSVIRGDGGMETCVDGNEAN